MKTLLILSLFIAVALAENTTTTTTTAAPATTTTTTAAPATTTTTTTAATTTTTAATTTTTAATTTTTAATTTTTDATTSTTTAATTSTPAATTVNPVPPTAESPKKQHFVVEHQGKVCILMDLSCQFVISYNNTRNKNVTAQLNLGNATVNSDSYCQYNDTVYDQQQIGLSWGPNNLTILFTNTSKKVYAKTVTLTYFTDSAEFPLHRKQNQHITVTANKQDVFSASNSRSYQCKAETDVKLGDGVVMSLTNVHVQANRQEKDEKFSLAEVCSLDDKTSNIVPIAVGCALAALVLIVLIAYCIGRRRSRQKGYQSV